MRCVNETLPPRVRPRWLLRIWRLTSSSLAGTDRTEVAVGTARLASMFATMRAAAPRSGSGASPSSTTGARRHGRGGRGAAGGGRGAGAERGAGAGGGRRDLPARDVVLEELSPSGRDGLRIVLVQPVHLLDQARVGSEFGDTGRPVAHGWSSVRARPLQYPSCTTRLTEDRLLAFRAGRREPRSGQSRAAARPRACMRPGTRARGTRRPGAPTQRWLSGTVSPITVSPALNWSRLVTRPVSRSTSVNHDVEPERTLANAWFSTVVPCLTTL